MVITEMWACSAKNEKKHTVCAISFNKISKTGTSWNDIGDNEALTYFDAPLSDLENDSQSKQKSVVVQQKRSFWTAVSIKRKKALFTIYFKTKYQL